MRIMLVDNEEYALGMLEILLEQVGDVEVAGKYRNAASAIEAIGRIDADAVFLDIHMPGMKGNEAARAIRVLKPNMQIVFTTAYSEYALEAFEIHAIDYLLKPIRLERLKLSMERIGAALRKNLTDGVEPKMVCMGRFDIAAGQGRSQLWSWRTNKEKELCAFLVHHRDRAVSSEVIIEALWPNTDVKKARANLYTCVWQLKRNLQAGGLPLELIKSGNGYSLDLNNVACDATMLEALLDKTIRAETPDPTGLETIAALYRGDYMEDCDYNWAREKREQLAAKYILALWSLYRFFKLHQRVPAAIDCLRRIVDHSPDSEEAGRELIRFYMEDGKRMEAVNAYRQLELAVHERLGIGLEKETIELCQRLFAAAGDDV